MNAENKEKVSQIKAIVDTLSDLNAITQIEQYMYNSRYQIGKRAETEAKKRIEEEKSAEA